MVRLPTALNHCRLHIAPHGVALGGLFMARRLAQGEVTTDKADVRSDHVLRTIGVLSSRLGRGPTVSEIAAQMADGKGDVRAELGELLRSKLVECRGLNEAVLAPCWILAGG